MESQESQVCGKFEDQPWWERGHARTRPEAADAEAWTPRPFLNILLRI